MNALLLKELRENFKWALLAMAAFGLAVYYALYPSGDQQEFYNYFNSGITLCRTAFLNVTTFGCAAIGLALGLIQILPELKRDRWAALLHRPVSSGTIYRGKAVAGVVLYAVAVLPPFLWAVWLAATPGHFGAPFVPELVLPGTLDLCMGVTYYFAALALALQRGGWVGLRALPLLAAVHASYFVLDNRFFYVAMEASVLMSLALFTAAWGEIHQQDLFRARPWLGKAAFLAVGIYGVCGLGDLADSFFTAVWPPPYPNFEQYQLTEDGTLLHIIYGKGGVIVAVQNLTGQTMTDPRYQPDRVRNQFKYLNTFSEYIGDPHGYRQRTYQASYRESRLSLWADYPYLYPRMEQWFHLVKKKYMIGFLPLKKLPFAVLDRRGFEPATAAPEGFPPQVSFESVTQATYSLWEPGRVRFAFLDRRQMIDVPLPAPGPVYGEGTAYGRTPHGSVNILGVALGSGLAVYDDKAALVTVLPYHQQMDRWGSLSLGINGALDRFYLRYEPSAWIDEPTRKTMPSYLEEMNRQGEVLHAYTLPPLPESPHPVAWNTFVRQRLQSPVFYFGTMAYKWVGATFGSARMRDDLTRQFGQDRTLTWEIIPCVIILSLVLSAATFFWARRVYFSPARSWAWAGFVFAFSLPGFIAFRLSTDWPRLVPCPRCSRGRPVEAEQCPRCGADWPTPPATGTEIFAPREPESLATNAV